MGTYVIDDKDQELINKLLEIYNAMLDKYEEIKNYDSTSKEYFLLSNQIYSLKYQANKLLDKINSNLKLQSYMEYLSPKGKINNFSEDLKVLISTDKISLVKRRLLITLLNKKITKDMNELYNMASTLEEDIIFFDLEEMCKGMPNPCHRLGDLLRVSNALKQDFLRTLSIILQDNTINNNYYLAFLYENLEEDLIKNGFEVDKNVYFTSHMEADLASFTEKEYNISKSMYGYKIADTLLSDKEIDLNNPLLVAVIKTCLLFCTEEELKMLKNKYAQILNDNILNREKYQEQIKILNLG